MVNEDGLAELRRRSARVAAVRRFSQHTVHRHSAEGGGCALPALPLAAIQDNLFSEALHGRSACERLAGIKTNCAACYDKYKKHDARSTKSPWRRALLFVLDEPRSSALVSKLARRLRLWPAGLFQRHRSCLPQVAPSFGQPQRISRLGRAGRPHTGHGFGIGPPPLSRSTPCSLTLTLTLTLT